MELRGSPSEGKKKGQEKDLTCGPSGVGGSSVRTRLGETVEGYGSTVLLVLHARRCLERKLYDRQCIEQSCPLSLG